MDPYFSSNNPFNISPQASTEEKSIHDNFDLNKKNVEKRLRNRPTSRSLEDRGILRNPGKANSDKMLQLNFVKTRDNIRKKISTRPEKAELIKSHILRDASCDQEQEKNRIKNMLDMRMLNRPGSLELIQKNILKVNPLLESKVLNGEIEYPKVESGASQPISNPITFVPHQIGGGTTSQNMYSNSLLTTLQNPPSLLSSINEIDISTSLSELSTLKETVSRQPITASSNTTTASSSTTQIKFHKAGKLGKYSIHNAEFQPQKAREYQQNQMLQFQEIQGQREQNMKKVHSELEHTQNSLLNRLNINELKAECKLRTIPSSNISKKQLVMRLQPFEDEILQKRKFQLQQHDTKSLGSNISPPPSVLSHSSSSYATISHPHSISNTNNNNNNNNIIHHCLSEPVIYDSFNHNNTNHIQPHNQNFIRNNFTDNTNNQNQFHLLQHNFVNDPVNNSIFPNNPRINQKNNNINRHSLIIDNSHQLGMNYNNLNHSINYPNNHNNHIISDNGYFNANNTISSSTTYLTWSPSPIKQSSFSFSNSLNDNDYFNYSNSVNNHYTNSSIPASNSFVNNINSTTNNNNPNNIPHQNDASQDLSLYNTPNDSSSLANSFEQYNSQINTVDTVVTSNNSPFSTITFPPYLSILPLPNNCEQKFNEITQEIYELSNVIAKMTKLKNDNDTIENSMLLEYTELLTQMLNSIRDAVEFIGKEFTKYNTITQVEYKEQDNWLRVLYQYVDNLKNQIVQHTNGRLNDIKNSDDAEIAKNDDISGIDFEKYETDDIEFHLNGLDTPDTMDVDLEDLLDPGVY